MINLLLWLFWLFVAAMGAAVLVAVLQYFRR
jgi:uncharacterized membrane protein YeaQ/YmgE (transglycosylase-associated protein family)